MTECRQRAALACFLKTIQDDVNSLDDFSSVLSSVQIPQEVRDDIKTRIIQLGKKIMSERLIEFCSNPTHLRSFTVSNFGLSVIPQPILGNILSNLGFVDVIALTRTNHFFKSTINSCKTALQSSAKTILIRTNDHEKALLNPITRHNEHCVFVTTCFKNRCPLDESSHDSAMKKIDNFLSKIETTSITKVDIGRFAFNNVFTTLVRNADTLVTDTGFPINEIPNECQATRFHDNDFMIDHMGAINANKFPNVREIFVCSDNWMDYKFIHGKSYEQVRHVFPHESVQNQITKVSGLKCFVFEMPSDESNPATLLGCCDLFRYIVYLITLCENLKEIEVEMELDDPQSEESLEEFEDKALKEWVADHGVNDRRVKIVCYAARWYLQEMYLCDLKRSFENIFFSFGINVRLYDDDDDMGF